MKDSRGIRLLYRDADRAPYLHVLAAVAERMGLQLHLEKADFGTPFAERLIAGETDFLAENYWYLQLLRARGQPIVSVATTVSTLNDTLFVTPEIRNIDDLRGRKMAVRAVGPSALAPVLWLRDNGLADQVELIRVPEEEVGRWGQWKMLLSGECQASFVTNVCQHGPREAGLAALSIPAYPALQNITLSTMEGVTAARRPEVAILVAAAFEASRIFRQDREAALGLCQGEPARLLGLSPEAMTDLYDILRLELSEQPVPTAQAIANTHRMTALQYEELAAFNPLLMWDLSFARSVAASRG